MKGMVGKKNSSWTVFIIVSVLLISTVTMYFRFLYYSKNIRATVVKQEINQIELTSNYITKIFHTEMEDCVDVLRKMRERTICQMRKTRWRIRWNFCRT